MAGRQGLPDSARSSGAIGSSDIVHRRGYSQGASIHRVPVSVKTIDRDHVDRFQFEVADGGARPLFFFDSDGARAGALWFIRRILVDHVDSQTARREAEELGMADNAAWLAATSYVAKLDGSSLSAPPAVPTISSEPKAPAAAVRETSNDLAPAPKLRDDIVVDTGAKAVTSQPESRSMNGSTPAIPTAPEPAQTVLPAPAPVAALTGRDQADPSSEPNVPVDLQAWRPFVAMVITGISVPLAFWTCSVVPALITRTWASLPAPALRPKSLLASSDD